jgi:HK97 family phage prohead protease
MTDRRTAPAIGAPQTRALVGVLERDTGATPNRRVRFVASDESVDRYGDIIRANGWQLDAFRRNPVLLFSHQSRQLPVGKVEPIAVEGTRLIAHAEFTPAGMNDFADTVFAMVDGGFLNAVSVGFMPLASPNPLFDENKYLTGFEYVAQELLELSVVPVPANPNALQLARSLKLSPETMRELFAPDEADAAAAQLATVQLAAASRSRLITLARLGR